MERPCSTRHWFGQKIQIQSSVSKGALKITTEIERDITNDPGMRSDYNLKTSFQRMTRPLGVLM